MGEWIEEWVDVKAVLRIAYLNLVKTNKLRGIVGLISKLNESLNNFTRLYK